MKVLIAAIAIAVGTTPVPAAGPAATPEAPAAASLPAPSAEGLKLAHQFLELSNPRENFMATARTVALQTASSRIQDEGARASAKARIDALLNRLEPYFIKEIPGLLDVYTQVYAREFSPEELRQMIAFAGTPAGQHYLLKYETLDADPTVLKAQTALWTRLTPVINDFIKEECGRRAAERVAAGDTKAKCPLATGSQTAAS